MIWQQARARAVGGNRLNSRLVIRGRRGGGQARDAVRASLAAALGEAVVTLRRATPSGSHVHGGRSATTLSGLSDSGKRRLRGRCRSAQGGVPTTLPACRDGGWAARQRCGLALHAGE